MTNRQNATAATDADGAPIYLVPTSNGQPFTVDAADLDLLPRGRFYWNDNGRGRRYVRCKGWDNNLSPARMIAGVGRGKIVQFHDGDTSNHRRDNLRVTGGAAKWADAAFVRPSAMAGEAAALAHA